ncbi:MAG: histidinol-phosphatase [Cyclobacteriaceae bacterium]
MLWSNYHNHSYYCDGVQSLEEHVLAAINQGIFSLGFSSHCPVPFANNWSMPQDRLQDYLNEVDQVKAKFANQIQIYKSLEVDYIPGILGPSSSLIRKADLDYTIGAVHFVEAYDNGQPWEIDGPLHTFTKGLAAIFNNDVKKTVLRYFELTRELLEKDCPTILAHADKIKMHNTSQHFFDETEDWYRKTWLETLEVVRSKGAIVEINTRGVYKKKTLETYPGKAGIEDLLALNIPICLNSDAHHPQEITGCFVETAHLLNSLGHKKLNVLHQGQWQEAAFDEQGLHL